MAVTGVYYSLECHAISLLWKPVDVIQVLSIPWPSQGFVFNPPNERPTLHRVSESFKLLKQLKLQRHVQIPLFLNINELHYAYSKT